MEINFVYQTKCFYICCVYKKLKSIIYIKIKFMASKKYLLLAGFIALFSTSALQAQDAGGGMYRGGGYDFNDTSLIPANRLAQHRDFMNGQYDFPAKPRNQWEIGVNFGQVNIFGDITSKSIATHKSAMPLGFGLTVRKALGYVVSTRLQFMHGTASGFNYQAATGYANKPNNPWYNAGYGNMANKSVYYNYKTTMNELSLQAVFALNNLKFHSARNKVSYYALVGLGGISYKSMVDAKDASGNAYNFDGIGQGLSGSTYDNKKTINDRLKTLFDGNYESNAESNSNRKASSTNTMRGSITAGAGLQFRLGKSVSLSIEDRIIYTGDDLLDGQRWQENTTGTASLTPQSDNINYLSIGINFNLGGNSVAPLWWVNPLDYGYNALKNKSASTSKCDLDADGDGISDCFDRCPNTPNGVSVDSHGCPFDTDGDGVADYKDKQLITPTECQPVDADGVGRCPDPACCKDRPAAPVGCGSVSSGTISFGAGSAKLSSGGMSQLNSLANSLRSNPNCKAVINGNGNGSKNEQKRSWGTVNANMNYMVDKQGIDRDRFIFQYGTGGDANSVEYRAADPGQEGPSNTPPPFPNLRK